MSFVTPSIACNNPKGTLRASQEETVVRLARAAEARDSDTGQHIHRMSRYCAFCSPAVVA